MEVLCAVVDVSARNQKICIICKYEEVFMSVYVSTRIQMKMKG